MTSLTVILSQDQSEWQTTPEKKKESIPITTAATKPPSSSSQEAAEKAAPAAPFSYMNVIKEKKANPCTFCPKKFSKPSALKAHLYSHTGEKPNSCPYAGCQRHFSLLSNLRRHIKIHTPEVMKKQQQQQQQRNSYLDSGAVNKRRVPTLLPSPYTPSIKIFPGASSIQQQQQQPLAHHRHDHHPSIQVQTPITKKYSYIQ